MQVIYGNCDDGGDNANGDQNNLNCDALRWQSREDAASAHAIDLC